MSGRMVDVQGLCPESVLFAAATQTAYGDTPYDRVVLIARWVATDNATVLEVVSALQSARDDLAVDPEYDEAAMAVVVLSNVLRVVS